VGGVGEGVLVVGKNLEAGAAAISGRSCTCASKSSNAETHTTKGRNGEGREGEVRRSSSWVYNTGRECTRGQMSNVRIDACEGGVHRIKLSAAAPSSFRAVELRPGLTSPTMPNRARPQTPPKCRRNLRASTRQAHRWSPEPEPVLHSGDVVECRGLRAALC
jgi:hypothetical protein